MSVLHAFGIQFPASCSRVQQPTKLHKPPKSASKVGQQIKASRFNTQAASISADFGGTEDSSADFREASPAARSGREAGRSNSDAEARVEKPSSRRKPTREGLPTSLFAPYTDLPPDGRSIFADEESCNPDERRCKTPIHVWEVKCKACYGSGQVTSRSRRGYRSSYTCLSCHGVGYIRRASSTDIPDLESGALTIGRTTRLPNPDKQK